MKIVSIVGTRPNFIKEYAIEMACRKRGIKKIIVHTGQHYDFKMSDIFFKELSLPRPKYINVIKKRTHGKETAATLYFLEEVLSKERPDVTLVYGDVNSTLAAAIASVKLRIPVAHIEAGIRSKQIYNPEEINRRVTDCVSDTLFAVTRESYQALINEGHSRKNVFLVGDVLKDSLNAIVKRHNIKVSRGDYHLATVHREENVDSHLRLKNIISGFLASKRHIKFLLHPRTEKALKAYNLFRRLKRSGNVELLPSLGYLEFIRLLAGADKVLTDSGGVRREAYLLKKPVISLIDMVWFPAILNCGWKYIADAQKEKIVDAIYNFNPQSQHPNIFGDGRAAIRIVSILRKRYGRS